MTATSSRVSTHRWVNESALFTFDDDPWRDGPFPLINMKRYLRHLAYLVNRSSFSAVLISGPKDARKSRGLLKMVPEWKRLGHTALDIDLKGKTYQITVDKVLGIVAKEVS